ncbi:MAG: PIN domain-containing protein [Kiritimatiellia bacterium]|jgi:toxin-antitoxin system PIN domain toxin|nr:PIN domain-containing protein [Kiritimatiellia bacterium]
MTSCDTNILFPACDSTSLQHEAALVFLNEYAEDDDFCLCEQVLIELYCLLRNPTVCKNPLSAIEAVDVIQGFRSNPAWPIVDVVLDSEIMKRVWKHASEESFAYRRIFDARLAATLQHHGVTQFATRNEKDFAAFGFERLWNPL